MLFHLITATHWTSLCSPAVLHCHVLGKGNVLLKLTDEWLLIRSALPETNDPRTLAAANIDLHTFKLFPVGDLQHWSYDRRPGQS